MTSLARGCFRWRFAVLGGWLATLLTLAALALSLGTAFSDDPGMPGSESGTAYRLLGQTGATTQGAIVWRDSATARSQVGPTLDTIAAMPGVKSVAEPTINSKTRISYASVTLDSAADPAPIESAALALRSSGLDIRVGGPAFTEQPGGSHGGEAIGLLAALVILFLVFRSAWAAALPIITGVVGVATSLLVVILAAHVIDLAATSLTMGALIGLGVGIDYALFIVNRYRKALLAGDTVPGAIEKAVTTSGRAVIFAGLTVIVALLGMYVVKLGILTGMAQAAAVTVLFTVLAAITLLPALLGILGRRVLSRRSASSRGGSASSRGGGGAGPRRAASHAGAGAGARWAQFVQRAPLRSAGAALLVVLVLTAPVLGLRIGDADASSDPAGSPTRAYYELMAEGFGPGFDAPLLLVAEVPDAASAQAFTALVQELPAVDGVASVTAAPIRAGQHVAVATVVPRTSAEAKQTADLVERLRKDVIPATPLRVYVGGPTASSVDLADALMSKLPLYLGLIALLGFLLLAVAFRSLLVPLIGAVSNLATIFVGLGAVTAIFQWGWGSELLGVGSGAPVNYLIPVLVMGIMFGLSMDYQVFLVSRMHEEWGHTRDNRRAVRVGLTETTRVIAAAATIMLVVFASFGFSGERIVSMIGIGLAVAVVVDAFVVRLTLMPALMTLIGRANWYYPRWAGRLTPNVSVEGPAPERLAHADPDPAVGSAR